MRNSAWMLAGVIALGAAPVLAADGDNGVASGSGEFLLARWQGRLSLGTASAPWRLGADNPAPTLSSASLMGDYYFGRSLAAPNQVGGLRATSGLIFGPRSAPSTGQSGLGNGSPFSIGSRTSGRAPQPHASDPGSENATLPYLGIGYTGLSPRSSWGFSADLGLVAKNPGSALRVGSGQSLDDVIRDMRMTPLLQLGVSYAF